MFRSYGVNEFADLSEDEFRSQKLGFKSGEGFRKWSPEQQAALRAKVVQHLKKAREADK